MDRILKGFGVMFAAWMIATTAHAGDWQYAFVAEHKMHISFGPASTGAKDVVEIVNHSCHEKLGLCGWSMSVAIPCSFGEYSLGVVVLPKITMPGSQEEASSFLQCGGPNPGLPGAFVYKIENTDMVREFVKVDGPVVMRVGHPKATTITDVTIDFRGAAPFVARAAAGLKAR